ncbi:MAG: triose-phosphate isomerase [Bacteroidetes bacterium]|jgi:triosephosphate isomerase|nr:triose-phosphate isomerase [Bacteroidota bacterium]
MRTLLIAGNWKMNAAPSEAKELADGMVTARKGKDDSSDILICPPFISIPAVAESFSGSHLKVGAQNVHTEDNGAFTGEISTSMLNDAGCEYVIVGHSERREYFHENDALIAQKAKKGLTDNLKVIVCVGEKLEERKSGNHENVVKSQVEAVLEHVDASNADNFVIAYEPVWAIGTGETASPEQAQEMHQFIRSLLADAWGEDEAEKIRILYGGSMKAANAEELLSQKDVDGGLIGGASLKAESFSDIIDIAESI